MTNLDRKGTRTALIVGHSAGMIDMVSLPMWVGGLMGGYGYSSAQAGGLVTTFLLGVVVASCGLAPLFHRFSMRWVPGAGFTGAALSFAALWMASGFEIFLALHLCAGLCIGTALSAVHGTIGRTSNPHRTFAYATIGFGIFSVIFIVFATQVIAATQPRNLFLIFAGVMAIAAAVNWLLFPHSAIMPKTEKTPSAKSGRVPRFEPVVWFLIAALLGMNFNQAMNFSFVERIANGHGWPASTINGILVGVALLSLIPAPLAVLFEKKFHPVYVGVAGVLLQTALSLGMTHALSIPGFAASAIFIPFVMIFSHTFLFGLLSRVEPTGRAVAANPAITMGGGALGPLVGGILVQTMGYQGISVATALVAACVVGGLMLVLMRLLPSHTNDPLAVVTRHDH
ncbi:MFS transporter (plasmid) [Agrobacterium vitis]|uniref:MFS transporter n=1 Tax=Agrobacterium vitis TaxID=373 RepID=UPI0012E89D12|nr:MFS transporter [Agrobacterium vitis]MVA27748.1 MFS transporter [Agrobacterium vitis]